MFVTSDLLLKLGACKEGVEQFKRLYPNGVQATSESMGEASRQGLNVFWFLNNFPFTGSFEDAFGNRRWYRNGRRHREDGPAVEYADGSKWWYLNGELHREDGPAVEKTDGLKYWYLNGKLQKKSGPPRRREQCL